MFFNPSRMNAISVYLEGAAYEVHLREPRRQSLSHYPHRHRSQASIRILHKRKPCCSHRRRTRDI